MFTDGFEFLMSLSLRSSLFRFLLAGVSESQGKVAQKEERGEGVGKKGKACSLALTFYETPFVHEREAIRHNDWSIARQSKRSVSTACQ